MFMPLYELLIDPLGLPIAWYWEYIILWIIDRISYENSFGFVGDMYSTGMNGKVIGSLLHCIVRVFYFCVIWAVVYIFILICKWVFEKWLLVVAILGTIILLVGSISIAAKVIKKKKV